MTNPFLEHATGLVELQTELGSDCPVITWSNLTIKVLPSGLKMRSSNSTGGFELETDFSFICLASDFGATLPASKQLMGYNGNKLKIESVIVTAGGLFLEIMTNHAAKK